MRTTTINKPFIDPSCDLSEGITYDARNHSLSWIDINRGYIYRTLLDSHDEPDGIKSYKIDENIGLMGLTNDVNKVIVGVSKTIDVFDFSKGAIVHNLARFPNGNVASNGWQLRSNDGCVDEKGNFWVGTMCDGSCPEVKDVGTLYRLNKDTLKLEIVMKNVGIPNGLEWHDGYMYWASSMEHIIYKFKMNNSTGLPDLASKQPFVNMADAFKNHSNKSYTLGEPDGFSMDTEGNIYSAVWGTNRVIKINSDGKVVEEFVFPAKRISCTTIGGSKMNTMYVTSGADHDSDASPDDQGSKIFRVQLDDQIKGIEKRRWQGPLN
ncbi:hypothetical protein FOA43_004036 [Brettanomyces nanus]|uniref:SMP-30/Gluconolactonase/LRE-like region domain-containing protein n=1 Tax=Eeniella nana TaxID=13502 RepID=A0A875SD22_EENNA|nr:uncharacterized protein FOA43_004036 [Brettanomyces nanus]QPG76644.1 hypothetical protein FOA43_004036 [Brettanomyces nanus]